MPQTTFFQTIIANLDLNMPWLLPALEAVEQTFPAAVRLPLCLPLMVWFVFLRQRNAASAVSLHRLVL